jgi:hypothetical protein
MSTVVWIAEQYSIHRTRTRHTKPGTGRNESAFSIVAKALEGIGHQMSEVNIEKIVKKTLE